MRRSRGSLLVALYLLAVVAANLLVARFGQAALPFTAFVLIPFDLCTRDALHELWTGRRLFPKMLALIAAGSAISYALNADAGRVAVASFVAFMLAGASDALMYAALDPRRLMRRMNGSNAVSSVVDSVVFPLVAFGALEPGLSLAQAASKFVGGLFWTFLYVRLRGGRRVHA